MGLLGLLGTDLTDSPPRRLRGQKDCPMRYKRIPHGIERTLSNGKVLSITGWAMNWTLRINGTFIERFEYMNLARKYADKTYK